MALYQRIFDNFDQDVKKYFPHQLIHDIIVQHINDTDDYDEIVDKINNALITIMNNNKVQVLKMLINSNTSNDHKWNYIEHSIRYTHRNDIIYYIRVHYNKSPDDQMIINPFIDFIYELYLKSPQFIYDLFCHQRTDIDSLLTVYYNDQLKHIFQ